MPLIIIFYRDTKYTSKFWDMLYEELGTNLTFSTTFILKLMGVIEDDSGAMGYVKDLCDYFLWSLGSIFSIV